MRASADDDSRCVGDSDKRAECRLADGHKTRKGKTTGGKMGSVASPGSSGAESVDSLSGQRCSAPIETGTLTLADLREGKFWSIRDVARGGAARRHVRFCESGFVETAVYRVHR